MSPARLPEDTVQRAWGEVIVQLAGDGDATASHGVLEMTMAAACRDDTPPICS
jgi:hypothetical protein